MLLLKYYIKINDIIEIFEVFFIKIKLIIMILFKYKI